MGIPQFQSSIKRSSFNKNNKAVHQLNNKLHAQYFYIDFNSIIYKVFQQILTDLNNILFYLLSKKLSLVANLMKKYDLENITLDKFNSIDLDQLILHHIHLYVEHILDTMVISDSVKYFYIAIDGVPTGSKLLEQQKRRYMRQIVSLYEKKLFDKHMNNNEFDTIRVEYNKHKKQWNSSKITPGSQFLDKLFLLLKSDHFVASVRGICKNLDKYYFSSQYVHSEGEMKIKRHIDQLDSKISDIVVYGNDSDVVIFSMIVYNSKKTIKVIRDESVVDVVDINEFVFNIYQYIKDKTNIDRKRMINDIVVIFSIFGNDFIPKIISFSVSTDLVDIIDLYIEFKQSNDYIVDYRDKYFINKNELSKMLNLLCKYEKKHINNSYIRNNIDNFKQLTKIFNTNVSNFTQKLNDFLTKLRNIDEHSDDTEFIRILNKLTFNIKNVSGEELITLFKSNPKINLSFDEKNINSYFHQNNLKKPSLFKQSEYDIEIYKLNNKLGDYKQKFNDHEQQFGKISINLDSYTLKTQTFDEAVNTYYSVDFKHDINSVVQNYMEGFYWVFDYYFNYNIDNEYANIWMYKYTKAPLLKDVCNVISNFSFEPSKYDIKRGDYINHYEQLMFVIPVPLMRDIIPKDYREFDYDYPDVHKIVDEIWNDRNKYVDCSGFIFINACEILFLDSDVMKFITKIRKFNNKQVEQQTLLTL